MKNSQKVALTNLMNELETEVVNHIDRVTALTKDFVKQLPLSAAFKEAVILGAKYHDLGKCKILPEVLYKQGRLTDEEFSHMKEHTTFGLELFERYVPEVTKENKIIKNCILYHHENLNGKGYPHGLVGLDIPMEARILKIVDVFEALTAERCYKKPWTIDEAIALLEKNVDTEFDATLTKIFVNMVQEKKTKAI